MSSSVLFERRDSVALVTLNRPEQANTLDLTLARALHATVVSCAGDSSIRAIVLTGAGQHFSLGGDLRGMANAGAALDEYILELTSELHSALLGLSGTSAPTIAAVNGTAAGAGIGLLGICDLAVAAETSKFVLAYTSVGLTPDAGCSFLLRELVGARRAMELLLTNRTLTASEALEWGLINRVVGSAGSVVEAALEIAQALAAGPTTAFAKVKRLCARRTESADLVSQMELEGRTIARQAVTAEGQEGIRAFLEKRKPRFV